MVVKFLKKVKSLRPKGSPKYLLHRHLAQPDKGRSYATVHASSLTHPSGLCPRMYALADVTHTKAPDSWLSTSLKMTFQIGRDQERNIVLWFAEMGRAVCHWRCATILYTTKGGYGTLCADVKKWGLPEDFSPFKEYDITRDDAETDDLALRARTVKEFRAGLVGMPEGICSTAFSQRAQECPLKGVCFGGHHPPKHHWKGTT
ncbi:MAG: hypothetical protein LC676_19750 [Loktanella sp.]|nr:hypothetical protein [Loktanella sp.]